MLHKLITRKSSGEAFTDLLASLISLMAMVFVVLFFIGTISVINRQVNMDGVVRGYILSLESQGCLTQGQVSNLITELESLGATDVEIYGIKAGTASFSSNYVTKKSDGTLASFKSDGTSDSSSESGLNIVTTPVGYGNRVGLKIKCKVPENPYALLKWTSTMFTASPDDTLTRTSIITKISTAKY